MRGSPHSAKRPKRRPRPSAARPLARATLLLALAACGDGATEPPPDPNRAPQPTSAIPPREIAFRDSVAVNLAGHFRDPDGDPLTFAATSTDPGVAAATVAGSVVTVRGVSRGAATVTVTATDPGGLSARQTFDVNVPNRGPEAVGSIEDMQLEVGDSITIDVSAHFTDPEGDVLGFSAASSDTSVVRAEVDGGSLVLAALAKGVATVTVTASDPGGETADLAFAVTVPNRAPFVSDTIPRDSVLLGDTIEVRLTAHFGDPDGDSLTFAAESSDQGVITVDLSGGTLLAVPVAPGTATVTVAATDPEGLSVAQSFDVTAAHPNRAPVAVGEIPDRTIYLDTTDSLDVSPYFSDPDGDSLAYEVATSRRIRVAVAAHGNVVALTAASVGSSTITVTARDPDGLRATQRFRAVVEPVPAPDLVVTSVTVDRDRVEVGGEFTLNAVVRNQGNARAQSHNTFRVYESFNTRITTDDREVGRDSVPPLGAGNATEVSVPVAGLSAVGTRFYGACVDAPDAETDTANNCSAAVAVVFWQPNRAPQPRDSIRARTLEPGDSFSTSVNRFFVDPDRDSLRYSAESSDEAVATASVSRDILTVEGRSPGTATITVTARDITTQPPGSFAATQRFEVTVRLRPRPDLVIDMVQDSFALGPEQPFLLSAAVRNEGTLDAPSGTTVRFYLSSDATIDASDGEIGTDTVGAVPKTGRQVASVSLTSPAEEGVYYYGACVDAVADESRTDNNCSGALVLEVDEDRLPNQPPTADGTFRNVTRASPGQRYEASLQGVFSDPDGDPLTISATSSNEAVARVEIVGDSLFVYTLADGTATITVTATDPGGLSASTAFSVRVCSGFCMLFFVQTTMPEVQRAPIRAAVRLWEQVLAPTELPDAVLPEGFVCFGVELGGRVVDDHMFIAVLGSIDGPGGTVARAGFCARRSGGGFPVVSIAVFDEADIDRLIAAEALDDVAFHEVAHGLGFIRGHLNSLGLLSNAPEPHFTGSGARAAFDAAGGAGYAGARVPMETDGSHWSESVLGGEIMTPRIELGVPQPKSAITLSAMADLGYSVNVGLADSYTLPDARPPLAAMEEPPEVLDLSDDVLHGPVAILGPGGRIVDMIPARASYRAPARPSLRITIDPGPPIRDPYPDSLRREDRARPPR